MLSPFFNQRRMKGFTAAHPQHPAAPLPRDLSDPAAHAAAVRQLCALPWAHPYAIELRRRFRAMGVVR